SSSLSRLSLHSFPTRRSSDLVSRTIPGVLSNEASYDDESHKDGLLEYPQYTRPYDFMGMKVPDILLSGHHANIEKWRRLQSLKRDRKSTRLNSSHVKISYAVF